MVARECPHPDCSPAYFRIRPGTGLSGPQTSAYCPYCRQSGEPQTFHTKAQIEYAKKVVAHEAKNAVENMIRETLDLGPSGRKKIGGDFLSIELSFQPSQQVRPSSPVEEELRRDLTCPHCGLEHAVFGLATWCPDCGADLFLEHVRNEFAVIRRILAEIPNRRQSLGARVAARDAENALEDTVSVFEAVLKIMVSRHLLAKGRSSSEVDEALSRVVRNTFQNVSTAAETYKSLLNADLFEGISDGERTELDKVFAMRHPITHNLGIVDRKYLERVRSGELRGREVSADPDRIVNAITIAERVLEGAYLRAFPPVTP